MRNDTHDLFARQEYINLQTYRRSGQAVDTLVWFVEAGGVLYVYTRAQSGKVKRVQHNPQVRLAPCSMRGRPLGPWLPGQAQLVDDPQTIQRVHELLAQKYGWRKSFGDLTDKLSQTRRVVLALEAVPEHAG